MSDSQATVNEVAFYFNLAIEQLVDVTLFFTLEKCQISKVVARCAMIKNGHIVMRVPLAQLASDPIVWGTDVNGYFSVRDAEVVPCHFKGKLVRIYNGPPDLLYLIFPLPRHIDHNQRRFCRRVGISEEAASKFGLWHGVMEGGGDDENLPQLRWSSLKSQTCELGELSANGLRLDMPEKSLLCEKMSINDFVLLKGDFGLPGKPCSIFVMGNIVRKMPKPDMEGIMSAGCHFRSWRKVDAQRGQTWFRVDSIEGIGMIAQWLSRNFRSVVL